MWIYETERRNVRGLCFMVFQSFSVCLVLKFAEVFGEGNLLRRLSPVDEEKSGAAGRGHGYHTNIPIH